MEFGHKDFPSREGFWPSRFFCPVGRGHDPADQAGPVLTSTRRTGQKPPRHCEERSDVAISCAIVRICTAFQEIATPLRARNNSSSRGLVAFRRRCSNCFRLYCGTARRPFPTIFFVGDGLRAVPRFISPLDFFEQCAIMVLENIGGAHHGTQTAHHPDTLFLSLV